MTELTLQRLTSAGWTPGRKVDISPIEKAYAEARMVLPEKLREFFTEFAFLTISIRKDMFFFCSIGKFCAKKMETNWGENEK